MLVATISNSGKAAALNTKLTLVDEKGDRVLPAYYSDNYVALLPGETRQITVRYPKSMTGKIGVTLRGWNVTASRTMLAK